MFAHKDVKTDTGFEAATLQYLWDKYNAANVKMPSPHNANPCWALSHRTAMSRARDQSCDDDLNWKQIRVQFMELLVDYDPEEREWWQSFGSSYKARILGS